MDIVLDTNILRNDLLLRSKDFEVLKDYLAKTDSSVILPKIIFDELAGLYKRTQRERGAQLTKAINHFNLTLVDETKHLQLIIPDENNESKIYLDFLIKKLNIKELNILPYKNEYLEEISKRAIERQKPTGENGQGFRDALIWLTIKNYCTTCHQKQIAFISHNENDFANDTKDDLHPSLHAECTSLGVKINFFKSIKNFIEQHSIKVDFLNEDWLYNNTNADTITEMVCDEINASKSSKMAWLIERETGNECNETYSAQDAEIIDFGEIFIYEMVDNSLIANFTVECCVKFDYEYYDTMEHWDGEFYKSINSDNHYLYISAYMSVTIKDNEVVDYDIEDFTAT